MARRDRAGGDLCFLGIDEGCAAFRGRCDGCRPVVRPRDRGIDARTLAPLLAGPRRRSSRRRARWLIGTRATAFAHNAARRPGSRRPAGCGTARSARRIIFRAPIRSRSCSRSGASAPCSAATGAAQAPLLVSCRVHGAGRDAGGCGAPRGPRGIGIRVWPRSVSRLSALAVSLEPDDGISCARR